MRAIVPFGANLPGSGRRGILFYRSAAARLLQHGRSPGEFVQKGVCDGQRPKLVGGGLIRNLGRWAAAKAARRGKVRIIGDERTLGDGDFVNKVLESCDQQLEQRYQSFTRRYDFNWLVGQVATLLGLKPEIVKRRGRYPLTVEARGVLCYWASVCLGISTL